MAAFLIVGNLGKQNSSAYQFILTSRAKDAIICASLVILPTFKRLLIISWNNVLKYFMIENVSVWI